MFEIYTASHTFLLIDLHAHVEIDAEDDYVAHDVENPDTQKYVGILEWNLLARLHHHKNDEQIGSVRNLVVSILGRIACVYRSRQTFVDS